MLELENITAGYGSITALHGVSLRVEKGSIVTLVGANGAGKSTTLRASPALWRCGRGAFFLRGRILPTNARTRS